MEGRSVLSSAVTRYVLFHAVQADPILAHQIIYFNSRHWTDQSSTKKKVPIYKKYLPRAPSLPIFSSPPSFADHGTPSNTFVRERKELMKYVKKYISEVIENSDQIIDLR
jgi:hypothetical protein